MDVGIWKEVSQMPVVSELKHPKEGITDQSSPHELAQRSAPSSAGGNLGFNVRQDSQTLLTLEPVPNPRSNLHIFRGSEIDPEPGDFPGGFVWFTQLSPCQHPASGRCGALDFQGGE